jgi:hypothetical protein
MKTCRNWNGRCVLIGPCADYEGLCFLFSVAPTLEDRTSLKRFVLFRFLNPKTVGRTHWMGDQPVARTLPIQTQNKLQTNIHALSRIRTHDPSVRTGEDSSCLRPGGHCDCHNFSALYQNLRGSVEENRRIVHIGGEDSH